MGNWFGKDKGVHPLDDERQRTTTTSTRSVKIKVRMTARQFKELVAQVDMNKRSNYNSELGRLILKQCLDGKYNSPVVAAGGCRLSKTTSGCRLSIICEEKKLN
ncbi:hypothetical protein PanWU01x14_041380 [Parasponia andersonii]|uniref:Uncharacterized protein n=1 Tax=Parasponia andersonii TaxID=3476 RepID=A0A2P5DQE3_PARAD|nr:hypothetical protein PanWU01x14_041380 [Parasponia andersonii]